MKLPLLLFPPLLAGLFACSIPAVAANLIGDVILGSYDVPSADSNAFEQYEFSVDPFTVEAGSEETNLNIIDGDLNTGVDFGASSVVFTFQQDTTWNPFPFNGTEFVVVSGNPFGSVVSVTSPGGEPVDAYVLGGVLFVNWQGDSFKAGDTVTIAFGVPEVPVWTMMALGFACLAIVAFRRPRVREAPTVALLDPRSGRFEGGRQGSSCIWAHQPRSGDDGAFSESALTLQPS